MSLRSASTIKIIKKDINFQFNTFAQSTEVKGSDNFEIKFSEKKDNYRCENNEFIV